MGSDYETSGAKSPSAVLQAYQKYLPSILQETAAQTPNTAQQQLLAANQTVNPGATTSQGINELNLGQLQKYALPEAQVGQGVQRSNALAGADTNLAQLTGSGGRAAVAGTQLTNALNPALSASSSGASRLVNSIDTTGLSPGEYNATERSLNNTNTASGNLGLVNPTNTISNAMNFGGAYNNKLGILNSAVGTATGAANASTNAINPVSTALYQPNASTGSNFGTGQFANTNFGTTSSVGNQNSNSANSLLGSMIGGNNAAMSAGASMANATSPQASLGAICCFIFLEAYRGKLPKCVRKGRDKYYSVNHDIATGYRMTAKYLVPLMKSSNIIRNIVWFTMVDPITKHLAHPKKGWRKNITHFWLRTWATLGKGKDESSYAMKWEYPIVDYV